MAVVIVVKDVAGVVDDEDDWEDVGDGNVVVSELEDVLLEDAVVGVVDVVNESEVVDKIVEVETDEDVAVELDRISVKSSSKRGKDLRGWSRRRNSCRRGSCSWN